jgi:hypothetical protein
MAAAVPSSALCMDKSLAYIVASNAGIATPKHRVLAGDEKIDPDSLTYPSSSSRPVRAQGALKPRRALSTGGQEESTRRDGTSSQEY